MADLSRAGPEFEKLPPLPGKKKKREASVTPGVLRWLRANHKGSCAFEIKASEGNTIPASALLPHQRAALLDAHRGSGLAHKITDEARRRQPFDGFMLQGVPAYVIACFTSKGICLAVPVDKWRGISVREEYSASVAFTIEL